MLSLFDPILPFRSAPRTAPRSKAGARLRKMRRTKSLAMTVYGSDQVPKNTVLDCLKLVKKYDLVTEVDIEDMVTSKRDSLLPVIKGLLVDGARDWSYFRFIDNVEDLNEFSAWQARKNAIMKDYEKTDCIWEGNHIDAVSFQATVKISQGTSQEQLLAFLTRVNRDPTVSSFSFGGALRDYAAPLVPEELCNRIKGGQLYEDVVVHAGCSWWDEDSKRENLLQRCISAVESLYLRDEVEGNHKKRVKRSNSKKSQRAPTIPDFIWTTDDEDVVAAKNQPTGRAA